MAISTDDHITPCPCESTVRGREEKRRKEKMKSVLSTLLLAGAAQAAPAINADNSIINKLQSFATPGLLNLIPRTLEIDEKRKGWLYGTFPFGVAPYPYGKLADKVIADDREKWAPPVFELGATIVKETGLAVQGIKAVCWNNLLLYCV